MSKTLLTRLERLEATRPQIDESTEEIEAELLALADRLEAAGTLQPMTPEDQQAARFTLAEELRRARVASY